MTKEVSCRVLFTIETLNECIFNFARLFFPPSSLFLFVQTHPHPSALGQWELKLQLPPGWNLMSFWFTELCINFFYSPRCERVACMNEKWFFRRFAVLFQRVSPIPKPPTGYDAIITLTHAVLDSCDRGLGDWTWGDWRTRWGGFARILTWFFPCAFQNPPLQLHTTS